LAVYALEQKFEKDNIEDEIFHSEEFTAMQEKMTDHFTAE